MFLKVDRGPELVEPRALSQQVSRLQHEVVVANAEAGLIAAEAELGISRVLEFETVRQIDALHHHGQLVKAIGAKPQNFQMQVHLGWSRHCDRAHDPGAVASL